MNTQIKTLLLLFNVCIVIFTYAISPLSFSLGDEPVRKVDMNASLAALENDSADVQSSDSVPLIQQKVTDVSPQRFLFVGDSMVEPIAHYFWNYAVENGHELYTVTWYGSSSYSWGGTRTLEHFMDEVKPTFIILCMGSNELTLKDMNTVTKNVNRVLEKVGDIPFVWIGPPSYTANNPNGIKRWIDSGYNDQLIQLVGADRFFDSRDMQMDRARDGLHPTMKGAVVWMEQLATWMQSELTRHPVILNTPQQKSTIQNLTVMQTKDKGFY
ncbi:MAG: SGNH/GDSL hydrolase family protein [Prevotella sp.]|nr:SGNH/GDSL hydrolase family protein [Prevotella sp.]